MRPVCTLSEVNPGNLSLFAHCGGLFQTLSCVRGAITVDVFVGSRSRFWRQVKRGGGMVSARVDDLERYR